MAFGQLICIFLLRKIALPYPHKCLVWFCGAKASTDESFNKDFSCREVTPLSANIRACADTVDESDCLETLHYIFGRTGSSIVSSSIIMADSQVKNSKELKRAPGCGHPLFDWDCHQFCFPCREKGRGNDVCVKNKEEDCFICLQFSEDQKRKLVHKSKRKEKSTPSVVSQEIEDALLGVECHQNPVSSNPRPTTEGTTTDPLQTILQRLDDMQGQLTALKDRNSEVSVSLHSEEGEASDEDSTLQELNNSKKRDRSPSPDDIEDDPSYRQTLAAVRSLLQLTIPEQFSEQPSRIFGSRQKDKRKSSLLPMVMPPVDGVLERWDFYEKKSSGNPQQDQPYLLKTNPLNYDNFLYFTRAPMKFYKSTSADFSFQAPRCQDSFRSSFPGPIPSSVRIPMKQHVLLETVNREHVQILSYVHFFLNAIEKTANNLESTMLTLKSSTKDQAIIKELETMLSGLQIQFSCIASIEKALENVTDTSIAASCNLELARRDTVLKNLAPNLNEHDFNRLRRTGFKSHDLFCPTVLNEVEKKIQKSPKRPRTDQKSSFSFKRHSDDRNTNKQHSNYNQKSFREQNSSSFKKPNFHSSQPSRRGGSKRR